MLFIREGKLFASYLPVEDHCPNPWGETAQGQVKPQTPLLALNVFLQTDLPTSSFASSQDPVVKVGPLKP